MKNIQSYVALLLLLFCSTALFGQREISTVTRNSPFKKMIHFLPLPLFLAGMELGYEKATSNKESFYMQFGYYSSQSANILALKDDGYSNLNSFKLELQYRFFLKTNNYRKNLWVAPFFNFKTISVDHETSTTIFNGPPKNNYSTIVSNENRSASTVSFGYMLGSRQSIFENIYIEYSLGGGIFVPVSGDFHKELNLNLINPYQKSIQFKGNLSFLIAL